MTLRISIKSADLQRFTKQIRDTSSQVHKDVKSAMQASALDIQSTAKRPGYAPYKTGTLRRSITSKVSASARGIGALFGSNLDYARIHEFGGQAGRNGSVKIEGKRYIQRAIEDNEDQLRERIQKAIATRLIKP